MVHISVGTIVGAINFITDIDYTNNYSLSGSFSENILKIFN